MLYVNVHGVYFHGFSAKLSPNASFNKSLFGGCAGCIWIQLRTIVSFVRMSIRLKSGWCIVRAFPERVNLPIYIYMTYILISIKHIRSYIYVKQPVFCTSTRFSEVYIPYSLSLYIVHMNVALPSYYIIYFIIHNINIHYSIIEIIYLAKYIIIIKIFVLDTCVFFNLWKIRRCIIKFGFGAFCQFLIKCWAAD